VTEKGGKTHKKELGVVDMVRPKKALYYIVWKIMISRGGRVAPWFGHQGKPTGCVTKEKHRRRGGSSKSNPPLWKMGTG